MQYVWLNINDGTFSNSWNEGHYPKDKFPTVWEYMNDPETKYDAEKKGWKLIEYSCINDPSFNFYNKMRVVTNTKKSVFIAGI